MSPHRDEDKVVLPLPLDESLYSVDGATLEFLGAQTGIQDARELKMHMSRVQAEAYAVHPYPCIRGFLFLRKNLSHLPAYEQLLALGRERGGAVFLDIGCCFGNDIRRAIYDGYPRENCVASDLRPEFWELGHRFFNSTAASFPVPFIAGDAFDPLHLEAVPPFYSPPEAPVPELSTLTSLNPLRGHVSAIHASALFHLFPENKQLELARALACLLSPEPGSMILGYHISRPEKGFRTEANPPHRAPDNPMFCHSPESWIELWNGEVFERGTVRVEAVLLEVERPDYRNVPGVAQGARFWNMAWSVTRLARV